MLSLSCDPSGAKPPGPAAGAAEQAREHRGRTVGERVAGARTAHRQRGSPPPRAVGRERHDLGVRPERGSGAPRRVDERVADGAHPADGTSQCPVPLPITW